MELKVIQSAEPKIHPTAVIDPTAILHKNVVIGPYAVIGSQVVIGAGSSVGPHCVIQGRTTIGGVGNTGSLVWGALAGGSAAAYALGK